MDLEIPYSKVSNESEAYTEVKENITEEKIKKFGVSANLSYDESDKVITATGKGFTLTMEFLEDCAEVSLKLSLVLRPLKKKILGKLEKELEKAL